MPRYQYTGDSPRSIPALGLVVEPGQSFESPEPINAAYFELVAEVKPAAPILKPEPPKEGA